MMYVCRSRNLDMLDPGLISTSRRGQPRHCGAPCKSCPGFWHRQVGIYGAKNKRTELWNVWLMAQFIWKFHGISMKYQWNIYRILWNIHEYDGIYIYIYTYGILWNIYIYIYMFK